MAVGDQIEQIVKELWRVNACLGWQQRVGWDDGSLMGKLAKASGATPAQVESWLRGDSVPPTQQALTLMSNLPLPLVGAALNGVAHG